MSADNNKHRLPSALTYEGLTPSQREAVAAEGRVLVSASAGSGKTTTMVRKIISAVAAGVPLKDMLVLVYNDAAANELRERLHSALFEAACVSDGAEREMFRDALDALASARIGTIHSFCRSLIKENFEKLGVSPSFDILSQGEAERYENEAMNTVFARYFAEGDEVFMQLADALSYGRKEDGLRDAVARIYDVTEIRPDREAFIERVRESFRARDGGEYRRVLEEKMHAAARRIRLALESVLTVHSATGQESYLAKCRAVIRECERVEEADMDGITAISRNTSAFEMKAVKKKGADEDAVELSKEAFDEAKKLFGEWKEAFFGVDIAGMHAQNAVFVDKLLEIVQRTDVEFSAMKRADDVMSYADLEFFAAELVRENDFSGKFLRVFVDEYQDVNPVQEFIIDSLLPADAFMVGDVKQSIYAFRLADPEIFLNRKRRYSEHDGGRAIEFNTNFRSVSAVLKFVNELFDVIMTEESAGVDYASEGHFAIGEDKKDADGNALCGGAEVHLFPYEGRSSKAGIYEEARFIAGKIRELISGATGEDGRSLGYGDCTVLVRSRSAAMRRLAEYIAAEGIPVDAGIFAAETSRAERELVRFLSVLDNPRNDIDLAGFMLSYFGGFDESDLAFIAPLRPEGGDLYDAVLAAAKEDDPLGHRVAEMLKMLDSYRLKASFKSVPELMQSIVSDFDLDAYAELEGDGGAAKLTAFVTAKAGKDNWSGIGKFLADYAAAEKERTDAKRPSGGNKVRFATYHAYKGLESPVVFAAGTASGLSPRRTEGDMLTDNRGYIGLSHFDFGKRAKTRTLSLRAVRAMTEERERREEMRIYYVLLTRAKQYIYVTGACARKKAEAFGKRPSVKAPNCLMDHISEVKYKRGISARCFVHDVAEAAPGVVLDKPLPPLGIARKEDSAAIERAISFEYPYDGATRLAMKYSVSALDGGGDELTLGAFADRADEGIIYHKIMEHIDLAATSEAAVAEEIGRMVLAGTLSEEEAKAADVGCIVRCLRSPIMQLARESVCFRERSFMMYLPAEEVGQCGDDKVLVQGVIDLLIDGRERVIVDFKNSYLRSEEALEKYKKQLNLYKKAVESSFFGKVDKILLYSFKTGRTIEL